jgi:integrase
MVVPAATALVPYEKFVLPAALDHEAIGAWLASKGGSWEGSELTATQRAYRKEGERLLLWAILERKKALSSLSVEDATAYRSFLSAPPTSWCGPRHHQRWSPLWRPLEGALAPMAARHALVILRSLFAFLATQGYVVGNPFAAVALPPAPQWPLGSSRTLSFAQWDHIDARLQALEGTDVHRRLRRAVRWLYATGLRFSEITRARCEDLEQLTYGRRRQRGRLDAARGREGRAHTPGAGAVRTRRGTGSGVDAAWPGVAGHRLVQPRSACVGSLRDGA